MPLYENTIFVNVMMSVTSFFSRVLLIVTFLSFGALSEAKVTGSIRTCKKIPLMKYEYVFEFLRAGHVYHYRDVEVKYMPNVEPVLVVINEETGERKKVRLSDHNTSVEDIHHLFESNGFEKKDDIEIGKVHSKYSRTYPDEQERRLKYLEGYEL